MRILKNIGPGTLVAAAFIGPGTVTVCTIAGVQFGYSLLWAMVLSVIATIVLQEMSARIGIITQKGLATVIKEELKVPIWQKLAMFLILIAIVLGNAAYEAGNIGGASLGLEAIFGQPAWSYYPLLIGLVAFLLLYLGNYKLIERSLVLLVIIMSISFLITAIITKPDITAILKGMAIPSFPEDSLFTIIALIGTTVVPYNLFLHTSLVKEKWHLEKDLKAARKDTYLSVSLGGIVSIAIIISAASVNSGNVTGITDLVQGLKPLYGDMAIYFLGVGMFAAGVTSAITAPLAAAYVAASCFNWKVGMKGLRFRLVWAFILFLGIFFLSFDIKPIVIIQFAQVANGILLPVIAVFLIWIVNKRAVMKNYRNTLLQNGISVFVVGVALILSIRSILKVIGYL
ncbi:Nramp family divalent metal transporter [Leptobacterium sp. I13]|uniref:Nramp family divalent metal transporter n=1 Tax=Leptobacterium meishanense TaxID=3128904 RepID=UPI0030ED2AFB